MITASVIGSGPNGLPAAIVLAGSGIDTTVFERNGQIGLACSSAETTLPNFLQDLGSSAYPLGVASPFFFAHFQLLSRGFNQRRHARIRSMMERLSCLNIS